MKSLISVVILLVFGSAHAQTQQAKPQSTQPATQTTSGPGTATAPATMPTSTEPLPTVAPETDVASVETTDEEMAPTVNRAMPPGVLVNLGLTYYGRDLEDNAGLPGGTNDDKINTLNTELRVGYNFDFGLFAGLTGHYDIGKQSAASITSYYVGPTVGYSESNTGIFAAATYYVWGNQDLDTFGEYDSVMGFQLDLGYPMALTDSFRLGPQLTYRAIETTDGSNGLGDTKTRELVPFLGLWYIF